MGLVSFTVSMLLHLLVEFLYHKFAHSKNILPLRLWHTEQDTPTRLRLLVFTSNENEYHNVKDNKRLQKPHPSAISHQSAFSLPSTISYIWRHSALLTYLRFSRLEPFSPFWTFSALCNAHLFYTKFAFSENLVHKVTRVYFAPLRSHATILSHPLSCFLLDYLVISLFSLPYSLCTFCLFRYTSCHFSNTLCAVLLVNICVIRCSLEHLFADFTPAFSTFSKITLYDRLSINLFFNFSDIDLYFIPQYTSSISLLGSICAVYLFTNVAYLIPPVP